MSENPSSEREADDVSTIYGNSPGSESAGPSGTTGHEVPPDDDTPTIYHVPDDEESSTDE
jgi:hypothetical protein